MNPICPVCERDFRTDGLPEGGPVPFDEPEDGSEFSVPLYFCSDECRDAYAESPKKYQQTEPR